MRRILFLLGCFLLFLLEGCAHAPSSSLPSISPIAEKSTETPPININDIPDAIPKDEPLSLQGNDSPYEFAGKKYEVLPKAQSYTAIGMASWYGKQFQGKRTASGERFDMLAMTGAHRSLPLPSYVKVTNLSNNKSVIVRINDRGPFTKGRLIDVSYAAAVKLGLIATGSARVKIEKVIPQKDTTEFETYPTSIENQTVSASPISQPASP